MEIDRDRRLVAVRDGPDDVLGAEGGIATEEDVGPRRGHRHLIDHRHAVAVELDADVALDPRKRIFLADSHQHVVARDMHVGFAGRHQLPPPLRILLRRHLLEDHAGQLAALMRERLRHHEVEDRDALVLRVFLFPRRGLHFVEAGAHDHLHIITTEAPRRAAAVHGRVAAAQHDDPPADLRDVAEGDGRQPVDADVDVGGGFAPAGDIEVAAARRAAADEDGVPVFLEQCAQAVDALARAEVEAEVKHVPHLLVDHRVGQPELGDLRAHHAARLRVAVEDHAFVAERREVTRHRQRRRTCADERDALAVLRLGTLRQPRPDVFLQVRGHALQAADGHGLGLGIELAMLGRAFFHAASPARGFAGSVTGAAEDAGKDVGVPVDEVSVAVAARRDHPDVFGNGGVGGTCPLAIDDLVEIIGVCDVRGIQDQRPPDGDKRRAPTGSQAASEVRAAAAPDCAGCYAHTSRRESFRPAARAK